VKNGLTIVVAAAALAATLSFASAGSSNREQVTDTDALPAYEILTTMRLMGLSPTGEPVRRGPYYVLHAYDPRGIEVRVVADAQFGDILYIAPARALNTAYAPRYQRGPRIIHVPQPGESDDRHEPTASTNNHDEIVPLPRRRATPPADGPTPIRPTPRFKSKADAADKFDQPRDASSNAPPPAGYSPPAVLPHSD
jgi:hypothetical protein